MHVKRIRMVGFKSFADETVIEPGTGITAVVGPNGCGKSNIVDAVRWVLGEKSGRALRGKNMEDVIFLGSEKRKQAGLAEVEIAFDNMDRSLSVDQDEVSIGRRLYLNSASEYILNGNILPRMGSQQYYQTCRQGSRPCLFSCLRSRTTCHQPTVRYVFRCTHRILSRPEAYRCQAVHEEKEETGLITNLIVLFRQQCSSLPAETKTPSVGWRFFLHSQRVQLNAPAG